MGIINWFYNKNERSRKQDNAWIPFEKFEDDGLTVFQKICNEELLKAFSDFPEFKESQKITGVCEKYIFGTLPNSNVKYWIYENCAGVQGYGTQENLSYDNPEQLIKEFVKRAIQKSLSRDD